MNLHYIGGQHFYYLESCHRQLWLHVRKVNMEDGFERIELGRLIHEETFARQEKEIRIGGSMIDWISDDGYIHETKSSKKMKKEHETQPLYYAYYLRKLGFEHIRGARIHYPEIRQVITLDLTEERIRELEQKIEEILRITRLPHMPEIHPNRNLCRKCAYFEFCHA
jgi:CRISPR-associated exonuclease Cas4